MSRLDFQTRLVECLSLSCLAAWCRGVCEGGAEAVAEALPELALLASHSGRASVVLTPGKKARLYDALQALPTGGACNPAAAVKLALVSWAAGKLVPCVCRMGCFGRGVAQCCRNLGRGNVAFRAR